MRRLLLVLVIALLTAGSAATAALATPGDDARAAAERFLTALVGDDANTACSLLTARVVQLLGGPEKCVKSFTADEGVALDPESGNDQDAEEGDFFARGVLRFTFQDARAVGVARGGYTTKEAGLERLVRDLRTLEPSLRFSIGRGPAAARGIEARHVIVDRRTSGRTLILYAESDSGVIYRLTAHGFSEAAKVDRAGKGIATKPLPKPPATPTQPEAPPTFAVTNVILVDDANAYVQVTVTYEGQSVGFLVAMKLEDGAWKVDDLLIGLFTLLASANGAGG